MGLLSRWKKDKIGAPATKETVKPEATDKSSKKSEKTEEKNSVKTQGKVGGIAYRVLIAPRVTEKATMLAAENKYCFLVDRDASKSQIKQAVAEAYGVFPKAVAVINVNGRGVNFGRRSGRRSDYKKAIVTLPEGKTLNIHEGV